MRVALVTDGIWPYVLGGMQKHSYYLCKYLARNKINVDLFHFNQSSYGIARLEFFSEQERAYISSHIVDFPVSGGFPGAYMLNSYRHSKLIFETIKDKLPDYDFIYTKGFTGWYLIEQKRRGKVHCAPVGVKFHGYEMFQKAPGFKIWLQQVLLLRYPTKKISRHADIVFSYGGKITEIILSLGVKRENLFELPSGVETETIATAIRPTSDSVKFLFLGRYERRKGIEELNMAIQKLAAQSVLKGCEFHFIGPIPAEKKLGLHGVFYHGEIRDKERLLQLTRQMDVLLCPSWSEGLPNSILEAMAAGMAVAATDVGAVKAVLGNENGWLISEPGEAKIAETIQEILACDPRSIDTKKQNALDLMRRELNWDILIRKFCNRFLNETKGI